MSPYDAYKTYLALRLHFTSDSYDFFKYAGKLKANIESFNVRKDRYFFEKLSRKKPEKEIIEYFVSNFIKITDPSKMWVGELRTSGELNYIEWKKRIQSLSYIFKEDLNKLTENTHLYEALFSDQNKHPKIIKYYLGGKITLETITIFNDITKFSTKLNTSTDPILSNIKHKIKKYTPFLNYNKELILREIKSKI